MTGNEARNLFLKYFQKHGHQVVRSSSLVPRDDPTLLFTNAGMVQFKRTFIGEEKRDYSRAVTAQKCVRAGGKHNDLENVGYTARHHTFFEMLGNFSFGDYFKEKAIEYGWDLLVNGYGLPKDKLWISVFLDDDEAHDIWRDKIGVPEERIVRFGEEDNFWAMGDTGPCGPCSEVMIDRGPEFGCDRPDCRVGCECDRYLEIWNLVFMQFNRDEEGNMTPLPKPSIDTGMGLERITSVIQNTPTNYETDLIYPVIEKACALSRKKMGESHMTDVALKVIADHSRAAAFLIGDGILPSNEGRGYVLRRIMRRAIRYGRNIGLERPFLSDTAGVVFEIMKKAYPELHEGRAYITSVIKNEETRFLETLDHGMKLLNETISDLKAKGETEVPGDIIFRLYDTFGFPADIVRDVVRDENMTLDMDGFSRNMEKQREMSRSKTTFTSTQEAFKSLTSRGFTPTFVGYDTTSCTSEVMVLAKDGAPVDAADPGEEIGIVTRKTPFYGEAGGQVGDTGVIQSQEKGLEIAVVTTWKDPTGIIIHQGKVKSGRIQTGDTVTMKVDDTLRGATQRNHTATHLLHAALRQVVGDHVKQSGSHVGPKRLRFDFTHFSQTTREELKEVEVLVNRKIRENIPVSVDEMDAETALRSGATALFEEKYGDRVRVITLSQFSRELCGGTHTRMTGDIGLFKIISESSVASGIRRIEAVTGDPALAMVQENDAHLREIAEMVRASSEDVVNRVEKLVQDTRAQEKEIQRLKAKIAEMQAGGGQADEGVLSVNGVSVMIRKVEVDNPSAMRDLADKMKQKIGSGIVVLASASGDKVLLIAVVTKDLTDRFHAGNLIKEIAAVVGGGGGGRPDMAQAGGTQPENLDKALKRAEEIIAETS